MSLVSKLKLVLSHTTERFYFHQNVLPLLMSAIPILRSVLKNEFTNDKIAIAFPDEGMQSCTPYRWEQIKVHQT